MSVTVNREELIAALSTGKRADVIVADDVMYVYTSNAYTMINTRTAIPCNTDGDAVSASFAADAATKPLSMMDCDVVRMKHDGNVLVINCGRRKIRLQTLEANKPGVIDKTDVFTASSDGIARAVGAVARFARRRKKDEPATALSGIHIALDDTLRIEAANGFSMGIVWIENFSANNKDKWEAILIPEAMANLQGDGNTTVSVGEYGNVIITQGNVTINSPQISGRYPDTSGLILDDSDVSFTIKTGDIIDALLFMQATAADKEGVYMMLSGGIVRLHTESGDAELEAIDMHGSSKFIVSPALAIPALRALRTKTAQIAINTKRMAMIIRNTGMYFLVMGMAEKKKGA